MLNEKTQSKGPRGIWAKFFDLYKEMGLFVILLLRGAQHRCSTLVGYSKIAFPLFLLKIESRIVASSRLWVYVRFTTFGIEIGSLTTK